MSASKRGIFDNVNASFLRNSQVSRFDCKAKCYFHKELFLTNFCKELDCLMPLCPECVKSHLEKHKIEGNYGDIERLENVLDESLQIVEKLRNYYQADFNNIENLNSLKREASNLFNEKILQAKNKIFQIIEGFFSTFTEEANLIFNKQQMAFFQELETSKKFIAANIEEIEKFGNKLKDPQNFVKYIIKLNSTTFYSEKYKYHKEIEGYVDVLLNKLVQPIIDESKLYSFNLELAKFVTLKNAEFYLEEHEAKGIIPPRPTDNYQIKPQIEKKWEGSPKYKSFASDLENLLESHKKRLGPQSPEKRLMDLSNLMSKCNSPLQNVQQSYTSTKEKDLPRNYTKLTPLEQNNAETRSKKKLRFSEAEIDNFPLKPHEEEDPAKDSKSSIGEIPSFSKYHFSREPASKAKPILKKNPEGNSKELQISAPDYFSDSCNFKYLPYFQPKSQTLFLMNLSNPSKSEETSLRIAFTIPENSRCLITPYGDIYLSGGSSNEKKKTVLNTLYKFNKHKKTLTPKNPMSIPRKAHGFAFLDDSLYVCGGLNENDENMDSCQRYEIRSEGWSNAAKLMRKSSYFSLIPFDNKFLFKFGGVQSNSVEKYDAIEDKWSVCSFFCEVRNFTIPQQCGGAQINPREILIFGGVENQEETKNSFVFRHNQENEKFYITDINAYALPFEGFVDTTSLVENGIVYTLLDSLKETSLNSKYLLTFNGRKWAREL